VFFVFWTLFSIFLTFFKNLNRFPCLFGKKRPKTRKRDFLEVDFLKCLCLPGHISLDISMCILRFSMFWVEFLKCLCLPGHISLDSSMCILVFYRVLGGQIAPEKRGPEVPLYINVQNIIFFDPHIWGFT